MGTNSIKSMRQAGLLLKYCTFMIISVTIPTHNRRFCFHTQHWRRGRNISHSLARLFRERRACVFPSPSACQATCNKRIRSNYLGQPSLIHVSPPSKPVMQTRQNVFQLSCTIRLISLGFMGVSCLNASLISFRCRFPKTLREYRYRFWRVFRCYEAPL